MTQHTKPQLEALLQSLDDSKQLHDIFPQEDWTCEEGGEPMITQEAAVQRLHDAGLQRTAQQVKTLAAWLTGHTARMIQCYLAGLNATGQHMIFLTREIRNALQKGVHDRREALEHLTHVIESAQQRFQQDAQELVGAPPPRPETNWVTFGRLARLLFHPDWYWGNSNATVRAKYLTVRIDTRDNAVLLMDGDGAPLDIQMLEQSCQHPVVSGMNRNTQELADSLAKAGQPHVVEPLTEPLVQPEPVMILGADGAPGLFFTGTITASAARG